MKKYLLLLLALSSVPLAQAQTDITSLATYSPTSSYNVPLKYLSTSTMSASAGGNQTWDYSGLSYSANATEAIKGAASTANGSLFPSANIMRNDYNYGNMYYNWTTTTKQYYGYYYNSSYNEMYSDPATQYSLPISYNVSQSDAYAYTKHLGAGNTSTCTGTISALYDGYGTLKTNNGTFTNVVRIKTTATETDTQQGTGEVTTATTTSYQWFSSTGVLIFIITDFTSTNSSSSISTRTVYSYGTAVVTGILENASVQTLGASPNPATNAMSLSFQTVSSGIYQLSISNRLGVEIQHATIEVTEGDQYPVDLSSLTPGLYVIRLSSGTEQRVAKFIKE